LSALAITFFITSLLKVIWEGKEPRRGAVAHVRRQVPIGYNNAPQIRPKSTPFRRPMPKLPACLIPGPVLPTMSTAPVSNPPFFHNALDRPTDAQTHKPTHRPTDRIRESLTTIGRSATRATRPNKALYKSTLQAYLFRLKQ